MKIWHISDTHTYHDQLRVPEGIDMIIFSGDATNHTGLLFNGFETLTLLNWMSELDIKYKIFVAGNHDVSVEKNQVTKEDFENNGIIYLENDFIMIEGLKIWGSPFTPTFGNWSFMKSRNKIGKLWSNIPDDTDIVITHGPPRGILDLTENRDRSLEVVGCNALKKRILEVEPQLMLFGHIHNYKDIINAGTLKLSNYRTIFSNGSVVTDNKFGTLSSNGNILIINNE